MISLFLISDYKTFSFFSVIANLISLCCLTFSIAFLKIDLFMNLKISFQNYFLQCFLALYLYQYMALPSFLIKASDSFLKNPLFNGCFKFRMFITYSVLSCKLALSFSTFSIFNLLAKKNCEGYLNFQDIDHQLQDPSYFYHYIVKQPDI